MATVKSGNVRRKRKTPTAPDAAKNAALRREYADAKEPDVSQRHRVTEASGKELFTMGYYADGSPWLSPKAAVSMDGHLFTTLMGARVPNPDTLWKPHGKSRKVRVYRDLPQEYVKQAF